MSDVVIGNSLVSLAELIGKGGEGEVYALKDRPHLAAKIYLEPKRREREPKIHAMIGERLSEKTDLVAYPIQVITDRQGRFLGFVMRLIGGCRPLHELYSPKSRKQHFPKADYRFLVHAALNVARAVGKVHQTGCVIGDLNHSGVLVAQDATIALIDADSFQFRLNGASYPCVVGVPDFTPPELHGKNLSTIERTVEHDNFGLAVAIFHLLFMGRHPYAGRFNGPDISMGEAIAQNRFAFSRTRQAATQTTPPPGALTLDLFPDAISQAFENAFGLHPGARPNAIEWIQALSSLEHSLNHCSRVSTHYYPSQAKGCVWCSLTASSGIDMFPDLSAVAPNIPTDARGTEQAIREIRAFRFPAVADFLPTRSPVAGASADLLAARSSTQGRAVFGGLVIVGAIAGFFYAPLVFYIWLGLAAWGWTMITGRSVDSGPFLRAYTDADGRLQRALDAFVQRNGLTEVVKVRGDLEAAITAYQNHDAALARELSNLKSSREARQRQAYLDRFSIRRAGISGIGPAKTATLISFGIETAGDVNRSAVLRVPGFGEVMTRKLLDWRGGHEARFRYDATPNAQDVTDERALRGRYAAEKAKLESIIRNGLGTLRNAQSRLIELPARARSDRGIVEAFNARAQAEEDLKELGVPTPQSSLVLSIAKPPSPPSRPAPSPAAQTPLLRPGGVPSCPQCGASMRRRSGRYGQFWGCSRYPQCRGTRN